VTDEAVIKFTEDAIQRLKEKEAGNLEKISFEFATYEEKFCGERIIFVIEARN